MDILILFAPAYNNVFNVKKGDDFEYEIWVSTAVKVRYVVFYNMTYFSPVCLKMEATVPPKQQ
jgi:hypothetical protein